MARMLSRETSSHPAPAQKANPAAFTRVNTGPSRRLRIAQIAPPHIPLPPAGFGGSELVAANLTEELVRRGHAVTVFAHPDSQTAAELVACPAHLNSFDQHELLHVAHALERADEFDIMHNHCLAAGPAFTSLCATPMLSTLHYINDLVRSYPRAPYVAISRAQRALCDAQLNVIAVAHNGVDCALFPVVAHKDDYLLYMGRMDAKKGPDIAVEVARMLGAHLIVAGPPPASDAVDYFETHVRAYLGERIEYIGEARGRQKIELLAHARCVLVPSRWQEPFGIVAVEAMACGTPVVATRRGALGEVVADGQTGFVVETPAEMAAAVERVGEIDPAACRRWVEDHFSAASMADAYLAAYGLLLASQTAQRPQAQRNAG